MAVVTHPRQDATDTAPRSPRRVRELDAVRGLAAAVVVVGHTLVGFPDFASDTRGDGLTALNLLKYSPLGVVLSGFAAVMVFFVLSGYVLTLQTGGAGVRHYGAFLIRRACRLWLPYIAAVGLAVLVALPFIGEHDPGLSAWFNEAWQRQPDAGILFAHASLVGSFANGAYDPVLWSLVHEGRISLIFPLLAAAVIAQGAWRSLAAATALALGAWLATRAGLSAGDLLKTLQYLLCFVVGIVLCTHRDALVGRAEALSRRATAALWGLVLLALSYQAWMPTHAWPGPLEHVVHGEAIDVLVCTAGAAGVIVLAQTGAARRLLLRRVPQFLGRISYSLYLVHAVVILLALHLVGSFAVIPPAVAVAVGLATLMHRLVEAPAQRLGRRLTSTRTAA